MNHEMINIVFQIYFSLLIFGLLIITFVKERFEFLKYPMYSRYIEKGKTPSIHEIYIEDEKGTLLKFELSDQMIQFFGQLFGERLFTYLKNFSNASDKEKPKLKRNLNTWIWAITKSYHQPVNTIHIFRKSFNLESKKIEITSSKTIFISYENEKLYWQLA